MTLGRNSPKQTEGMVETPISADMAATRCGDSVEPCGQSLDQEGGLQALQRGAMIQTGIWDG